VSGLLSDQCQAGPGPGRLTTNTTAGISAAPVIVDGTVYVGGRLRVMSQRSPCNLRCASGRSRQRGGRSGCCHAMHHRCYWFRIRAGVKPIGRSGASRPEPQDCEPDGRCCHQVCRHGLASMPRGVRTRPDAAFVRRRPILRSRSVLFVRPDWMPIAWRASAVAGLAVAREHRS